MVADERNTANINASRVRVTRDGIGCSHSMLHGTRWLGRLQALGHHRTILLFHAFISRRLIVVGMICRLMRAITRRPPVTSPHAAQQYALTVPAM
jgi:hypothetical protein